MLNEDQAPLESAPQEVAQTEVATPEPDVTEVDVTELIPEESVGPTVTEADSARRDLKSLIEAIVYITEEPVTPDQIAKALEQPLDTVVSLITELSAEFADPSRGLILREVAGGYKMGTKPEHHEALKAFAKSLKPPVKLSLADLETLAVIAYKQPVTSPEIMEVRGVQGAGVLKTLLDRKLIVTAGRKQVVGKPMMYKTSKEFLLQFGLKDLSELPTLKEFEELRRLSLTDEPVEEALAPAPEPEAAEPQAEPPVEPETPEPDHA